MEKAYAFLEEPVLKDRRKKKTVVAIKIAFMELLQEKELENITISELAEKADVNRKTIYNYYESIEQLAQIVENNFYQYMFDLLPDQITIQNTVEIYNFLETINKIWFEHKDLMQRNKKLLQSSLLQEHMALKLDPYIQKCMKVYQISEDIIPFISAYILHGLAAIYLKWLDGSDLTIDQLTLLCYNLILSSLHLDNFKDIL